MPSKPMVLDAAQRITKVLVWMMRDADFMGMYPIAMVGDTKVLKKEDFPSPMGTAYTDGANVRLCDEFVEKLTEPELRFTMLHETYHKMYRHIANYERLWRENPRLANIAMDYRVNADILAHGNTGVKMPAICLFEQKYADASKWDVIRIYKDLAQNGGGQGKCNGNCQAGQGKGQPNGSCTCQQGLDAHGWDEAQSLSPAEQRALAQEIDQAIRQGQRLAGTMGGKQDRAIGDLLKVKTDYRAALREFLRTYTRGTDETSWARVNRRGIANDIYLPGAISEAMGEMFIGIDTSGSIQQAELTYFLSNVAVITETIKPLRIHLAYWDTAIGRPHETYEPHQYESIAKSTKPYGGGGTSPKCVVKYLKEHNLKPEVIIMLTDGYIDSCPTDFPSPVLWAVIQNQSFSAPSPQKVIHLPDGWTDN